jgi:hypothetical protein
MSCFLCSKSLIVVKRTCYSLCCVSQTRYHDNTAVPSGSTARGILSSLTPKDDGDCCSMLHLINHAELNCVWVHLPRHVGACSNSSVSASVSAGGMVLISTPSAASSERQRGTIVTNNTGIVLRLFDGVLF